MTLRTLLLLSLLTTTAALAQDESRVHSDFRREAEALAPCKTFSFGNTVDCAQTLFTGQPLHIAVGSLAPQNGFAAGLAFVEHKNYANEWRMTFNTDAVASENGSWRAGAYIKAYRLAGPKKIGVTYGPAPVEKQPFFHVAPVFNFYAEATSLNQIYFYGLGPNTLPSGASVFAMTETIGGGNAILPLGRGGVSILGEVNFRVPVLRGNHHESAPSIETLYTEATAPGLTVQPSFLEPSLGLRIQPELFQQSLRLHYLLKAQEYYPVGNTSYSFRRWTTDFGHEFPLNSKVHLTAPSDQNGPDSCAPDAATKCPSPTKVSSAINHEGSINLRLLMVGSSARAGNAIPFYFDPTIGGSDLDGQSILSSYPDYRFRSPNLILFRETIEHAIPKLPLGAYFGVDQAKAPLLRNEINFNGLKRSYTVGLTVHAGGLPVVNLLFSWGGKEGNHTALNVSDTLLGASARPSLF